MEPVEKDGCAERIRVQGFGPWEETLNSETLKPKDTAALN